MSKLTSCCRRSADVSYKYSKVTPASASPSQERAGAVAPLSQARSERLVAAVGSRSRAVSVASSPGPRGPLSLIRVSREAVAADFLERVVV